jgi:hypothetical protein
MRPSALFGFWGVSTNPLNLLEIDHIAQDDGVRPYNKMVVKCGSLPTMSEQTGGARMRAAEFKVIEDAKRATQGQYRQYYQVMGSLGKQDVPQQASKKKPLTKQDKK